MKELSFFYKLKFFKDVYIDVIDIHLNEPDLMTSIRKIDLICNFFEDKIISVNLSRKRFSNVHMIELLEKFSGFSKNKLILEIEGLEFYNANSSSVLQTVSTADIINKQFKSTSPKYKKTPLLLGNFSNGEVEKLARECNVPFNGININYRYFNNLVNKYSMQYTKEDFKEILDSVRNHLFKDN